MLRCVINDNMGRIDKCWTATYASLCGDNAITASNLGSEEVAVTKCQEAAAALGLSDTEASEFSDASFPPHC